MNIPAIVPQRLDGVFAITPLRFVDERGFFSETYNRAALLAAGIACDFVQDNHSLSHQRGVIRGLHFQIPPFAQAKLIRVLRGAIYDVAVDLRRNSPTYAHNCAIVLSAENGMQLFVPAGFAHGFCTLEPDTEVFYKVSAPHASEHERGLTWNDQSLNIAWPISPAEAILNDRDRRWPPLKDLAHYF
ncbi:MAG TPA: dTDP-4-dehydrorhamnose 3,5-epimerase [Rhizomicrobium sp.]|jgi:dTDP-4-dehydrorhamnose 3,5-epimerase